MKKIVLLAALFMAFIAPTMAWSQSSPGGNGGPPPQASGAPGGEAGSGQNFQQHKAEITQHISEHIAEAQKRLSCVQAASSHEAMRACMPERGGRGGMGGEGGHDDHGGQH
jgi:hypothetical protein